MMTRGQDFDSLSAVENITRLLQERTWAQPSREQGSPAYKEQPARENSIKKQTKPQPL